MKDSYINLIVFALIIKHIAVLVTVDTQLLILSLTTRDKDFKDSTFIATAACGGPQEHYREIWSRPYVSKV